MNIGTNIGVDTSSSAFISAASNKDPLSYDYWVSIQVWYFKANCLILKWSLFNHYTQYLVSDRRSGPFLQWDVSLNYNSRVCGVHHLFLLIIFPSGSELLWTAWIYAKMENFTCNCDGHCMQSHISWICYVCNSLWNIHLTYFPFIYSLYKSGQIFFFGRSGHGMGHELFHLWLFCHVSCVFSSKARKIRREFIL